jgi:hypothetical protein
MQALAYIWPIGSELRRTCLPGTRVNRGKEKGRIPDKDPAPYLPCPPLPRKPSSPCRSGREAVSLGLRVRQLDALGAEELAHRLGVEAKGDVGRLAPGVTGYRGARDDLGLCSSRPDEVWASGVPVAGAPAAVVLREAQIGPVDRLERGNRVPALTVVIAGP